MDDTSAFEQLGQEFLFSYGAKELPLKTKLEGYVQLSSLS